MMYQIYYSQVKSHPAPKQCFSKIILGLLVRLSIIHKIHKIILRLFCGIFGLFM